MWKYQKMLQHPVKIKNPNPAMAKIILSQLGGPDGEMGAATRYLSQRYAMPYDEAVGVLTDIGISVVVKVLFARGFLDSSRLETLATLSLLLFTGNIDKQVKILYNVYTKGM